MPLTPCSEPFFVFDTEFRLAQLGPAAQEPCIAAAFFFFFTGLLIPLLAFRFRVLIFMRIMPAITARLLHLCSHCPHFEFELPCLDPAAQET